MDFYSLLNRFTSTSERRKEGSDGFPYLQKTTRPSNIDASGIIHGIDITTPFWHYLLHIQLTVGIAEIKVNRL